MNGFIQWTNIAFWAIFHRFVIIIDQLICPKNKLAMKEFQTEYIWAKLNYISIQIFYRFLLLETGYYVLKTGCL